MFFRISRLRLYSKCVIRVGCITSKTRVSVVIEPALIKADTGDMSTYTHTHSFSINH